MTHGLLTDPQRRRAIWLLRKHPTKYGYMSKREQREMERREKEKAAAWGRAFEASAHDSFMDSFMEAMERRQAPPREPRIQ